MFLCYTKSKTSVLAFSRNANSVSKELCVFTSKRQTPVSSYGRPLCDTFCLCQLFNFCFRYKIHKKKGLLGHANSKITEAFCVPQRTPYTWTYNGQYLPAVAHKNRSPIRHCDVILPRIFNLISCLHVTDQILPDPLSTKFKQLQCPWFEPCLWLSWRTKCGQIS